MREKTFKNSPKGRSEIPEKAGSYILLDKEGKGIYEGMTDNLKRRIKEHHYDKSKEFSYIRIKKMVKMAKNEILEVDPYSQARNIEHKVDIDTEGKISLDSILDKCSFEQLKEILELLDENSERAKLTDSEITIDNMEADFTASVEIEQIFTSLSLKEEGIVKRWITEYLKKFEEDN